MEMYADGGARGGVLEPEGMVEIKFRTPDLRAAMARIDPLVRKLNVRTFGRYAVFAELQWSIPQSSVLNLHDHSQGGQIMGPEVWIWIFQRAAIANLTAIGLCSHPAARPI